MPKSKKLISLSEEAHTAFKLEAVKAGVSYQRWIENFLEEQAKKLSLK